jgi:hypothetical protein
VSGLSVSLATRARAHQLLRARRLGQAVEAIDAGAIPEDMTFRQWCEDLGNKGLLIDRKPFRLDDRPALIPIYDAIPTTRAEAARWTLVMQKATQLGLTVLETLADIYMAKKWGPVNIGLFLPDQAQASFKSHHRFMPIVRSAPLLYRELMTRPPGEGRGNTEGNVMTRQFGHSLLMFLWTSGKLSTESRPMDIVTMDEVQGMSLEAIDKVRARMGDSAVRFTLLLSTANMPEADINAWYNRGTQEVWHTRCPHCAALSDLSDPVLSFPDRSIGFSDGTNHQPIPCLDERRIDVINGDLILAQQAPLYYDGSHIHPPTNDYVFTCPECGGWIADPQEGEYIAANPTASVDRVRSFLLPRTISPRITPREMISDWRHARTGDQRKSFYNRTLARPYVDVDQLPVTLAHCAAAVVEGRRLGLVWETEAAPGASYYMGVDQMGGYNCVVIKKRLPDGRQAVVHVAAIYGEGDEAFTETSALMERFRISVCVIEQGPNFNSARAFSNRHPGRVFINTSFVSEDMVTWADQEDRSKRRTADEDVSRYTLGVNQYKLMQRALYRVRDLQCLFPDPDLLEQEYRTDKGPKRVKLLQDVVFLHFTKTALVVENSGPKGKDGIAKERRPRMAVQKIGLDPHFSFANMLCDAAWSREQGTGSIFIPSLGSNAPESVIASDVKRAVEANIPVPQAMLQRTAAEIAAMPTCGSCEGFDVKRGWCKPRRIMTGPKDHKCSLYVSNFKE